MTENLKPDLPRRTNINYRRNTFKKSDKKENTFLNRMLFRICTCAIIVVFVLAVSKADGEKMKNFKYRLKSAVSQSITKDELSDTGKFLKHCFEKIKNNDFLNFNSENKKAEVYREKVYFSNNDSVIAENTISPDMDNDKFG